MIEYLAHTVTGSSMKQLPKGILQSVRRKVKILGGENERILFLIHSRIIYPYLLLQLYIKIK